MTEKFLMRAGSIVPGESLNYIRQAGETRAHKPPIASCGFRQTYRASTGTYLWGYSGPMYSARGRMRRLLLYCSRTWAVQPEMRLTAKMGVNRSVSMPSAWYVEAE